MGRRLHGTSLGGVRDEAEIRGHRRTYIGALPGRLVRALRDAGTMNPVIMLDEVDKVGAAWQGDPSCALIEVVHPRQHHSVPVADPASAPHPAPASPPPSPTGSRPVPA